MKKIFTIFTACAVGLTLTTSCNKKLKDDIKDLEKSVDEQKAQTTALQTQVNTLNTLLLLEPLTYSFSTTDALDKAVSQSGSLSFGYGSNYSSSYIEDNGNGTYYVYLWRGTDLGTDFQCNISFDYNPTTNVITNHYARIRGVDSNNGSYYAYFNGTTDITYTASVTSFDFAAGTIAFSFAANTTSAYGNVFSGKPMTMSSSYSGAMAKYNN